MKRLPRSGSISPAAIFKSVDLPEPFRPTRQARSPDVTTSSASSRSGAPPNTNPMFCKVRRGGAMIRAGFAQAIEGQRSVRARFAFGKAHPGSGLSAHFVAHLTIESAGVKGFGWGTWIRTTTNGVRVRTSLLNMLRFFSEPGEKRPCKINGLQQNFRPEKDRPTPNEKP